MIKSYTLLNDGWAAPGLPIVEPQNSEPSTPAPDGWDDMIALRSLSAVEDWFSSRVGIGGLGLTENDLTSGSLVSSQGGQVFEGIRATVARWSHDDILYRGCLIDWSGSLYAAYGNPTYGNPYKNIRFENCTFIGPFEDAGTARRAAVVSATTPGAVTFSFCDFYGGTSGIANDSSAGGCIAEYNWIHDLAAPIDPDGDGDAPHRTSLRTSAGGGRFYRNYTTDGGSSCISAYFDKNPIHNFEIRENIMNGSSPNASPSFLINMKDGEYDETATGFKVVDNYFGPMYQFGLLSGANVRWGVDGNELSGNQHFLTGEPI